MKAIFTPTNGNLRVFESDDAQYGQKYVFNVSVTLYDKGKVAYIEGLKDKVTTKGKNAIFAELGKIGVRYVRWSHTNNRGHEVNVCCDLENGGKMRLE